MQELKQCPLCSGNMHYDAFFNSDVCFGCNMFGEKFEQKTLSGDITKIDFVVRDGDKKIFVSNDFVTNITRIVIVGLNSFPFIRKDVPLIDFDYSNRDVIIRQLNICLLLI